MEKTKVKKPDRRIAKTKKAICNAFTELLAKKEMENITIKDIADLADVNRKTVYNYYGSTRDILDEIEDNVFKSYEKVLSDLDFSCNYKNTYKAFETLTDIVKNDLFFYQNLITMSANAGLANKLLTYTKGRVKDAFLKENVLKDNSQADILATYIVSGMIDVYRYWFTEGQNIPLEEFSKNVHKVVSQGLSGFVK